MGLVTNQHHGRARGNELHCSGLRRRSFITDYVPSREKKYIFKISFYQCIADSDDSDNEGGLGNVERVVMRPPGHSGKAKKGHLCFDAIYETGNILDRL